MRFVRKHDEAGGATIATNGFVELDGLQGNGAGVSVFHAVHEEDGVFYVVGGEVRGDFEVDVGGFPNRATLVLETEGSERFVVRA